MMNAADSYRRFLQGDNAALEELVRAYGDNLIGYAYCFLRDLAAAEDVMEDTFATLIVKRKKFDERRGAFESYLYRIARNKCIDALRKRKREQPIDDTSEIILPHISDTDERALDRARDEKLFACLLTLRDEYRDVLYLTYFQGFSADEVKRSTGKSKKQIYNLLARAKAALKQILIKEGIGHEDLR